MMGKEVLLIVSQPNASASLFFHQKITSKIYLKYASTPFAFIFFFKKNIPMIIMATILGRNHGDPCVSSVIPLSWVELDDFSSRYSTNREREREEERDLRENKYRPTRTLMLD